MNRSLLSSDTPWRSTVAVGTALVATAALFVAPVRAQQNPATPAIDAVTETRQTVEQWVETRNLASKERRDWQLGKEAMSARMELLRREIATMQQRTADANKSVATADEQRAGRLAENEQRKAAGERAMARVQALETKLLAVLPRLPEPLQKRIAPLTQQLTGPAADNKASLGERWQNVIGALGEIDKWNREVVVTSEVRAVGDGQSVEVTVLYLGLGQAFYASSNGRFAGRGAADASGWKWQRDDAIAADVLRTIAVWKNEQVAAFVRLPVQVQ